MYFSIPEWKSAPFWPMLVKEGSFKWYVRSGVKLKNVDAVCRRKGNNGILRKIGLLFDMLFLKIEF